MSWNAVLDDANIYIPFEKFGKYLLASAAKVYSKHETDLTAAFFHPKDLPLHAHNGLNTHKS